MKLPLLKLSSLDPPCNLAPKLKQEPRTMKCLEISVSLGHLENQDPMHWLGPVRGLQESLEEGGHGADPALTRNMASGK